MLVHLSHLNYAIVEILVLEDIIKDVVSVIKLYLKVLNFIFFPSTLCREFL